MPWLPESEVAKLVAAELPQASLSHERKVPNPRMPERPHSHGHKPLAEACRKEISITAPTDMDPREWPSLPGGPLRWSSSPTEDHPDAPKKDLGRESHLRKTLESPQVHLDPATLGSQAAPPLRFPLTGENLWVPSRVLEHQERGQCCYHHSRAGCTQHRWVGAEGWIH